MDHSLLDLLTKLSGVALSNQTKNAENTAVDNSTKDNHTKIDDNGSFLKNYSQNSASQVKNKQPKSIIGKKSSQEAIIEMINRHNARSQKIQNNLPQKK